MLMVWWLQVKITDIFRTNKLNNNKPNKKKTYKWLSM